MKNQEKKERNILIMNPGIARDLIQKKYELVDISENRNQPGRTVFFFKPTQEVKCYLKDEYNLMFK